jgi:hypothetical protein
MLELTVSHGNGNLILGVTDNRIKYRINGEEIPIYSDPLNPERIIFYSKREDGGRNPSGGASLTTEEISFTPKMDYYPIICKNMSQEILGRITGIKEKNLEPQS